MAVDEHNRDVGTDAVQDIARQEDETTSIGPVCNEDMLDEELPVDRTKSIIKAGKQKVDHRSVQR